MKFTYLLRRSALLTAICVVPNWAAAQSVTSFTVVNADTGADIATFTSSGSVSLSATPNINVRANASSVGSIVFSGTAGGRVESSAPYAYKGDSSGSYTKWSPTAGTYTINARPFSGTGGTGTAGATATLTLTLTFTSTGSGTGPVLRRPPTVNAGIDLQVSPPSRVATLTGSASDVDGTVVSTVWSQVAGPSVASLGTNNRPTLNVTNLSQGRFVFRLTATDNQGNVAFDDAQVSVGPVTERTGKLMIDPESVHHFVYDRDNDGDGRADPAYLAGVGGPEGFLYEAAARRQEIITKLLSSTELNTPVNGIYFHSMRAFGGDGSADSPFLTPTDQYGALNEEKLALWYADLKKLDDAGVILWFALFDDHAIPYGCKYNSDYLSYATRIVNKFKDLKHIVWVTQEEYQWSDLSQVNCTVADNDERQRGLAVAIRAADPIHPIGTHHRADFPMAFPNDPNIRVFGQQTATSSPEQMHDKVGKQGWGNWVYVMAEAHPWHQDLIDAERTNGAGREPVRRSNWASAMSGGYVMMYNAFECNNGARLCTNNPAPDSDPTVGMLDDLRRLKLFMESTQFNRMTPLFDANGSELANAKLDGTKYILANQSAGLYILYGDVNTGKLGVRNAPVGTYTLKWFDPASGQSVNATGTVNSGGLASFTKPAGFGPEVALYMRKN